MTNPQLRGTPFSVTASGTSVAQAVTTGTNVTYYVTDIAGSSVSGGQGTWAVLFGATGSTVAWAGAGTVTETLSSPLKVASSGTISFLMNGTTITYANFSGFTIP